MRKAVEDLVAFGPLPDSVSAASDIVRLEEYQQLLESIELPASRAEAEALATLFGPDDCFGLAWTLLHLIESVPGGLELSRLPTLDNPWLVMIRERSNRSASE